MNRQRWIVLIAGLAAVLGVAAMFLLLPSGNDKTKPDNAAHLVFGTPEAGLLVKEQWGKSSDGKDDMRVGAPTIIVVGNATIANLCQGAITVNNYGADEPEHEAAMLQKYCDTAASAAMANDMWTCTNALVDLARNTNRGYMGASRLSQAFTNTNISVACHDDKALAEYKRLGIGNQPVVTDA